jgi:hypothetical protein
MDDFEETMYVWLIDVAIFVHMTNSLIMSTLKCLYISVLLRFFLFAFRQAGNHIAIDMASQAEEEQSIFVSVQISSYPLINACFLYLDNWFAFTESL